MSIRTIPDSVFKAFYRHIKNKVGDIKGKELTQAQYDALSTTDKNNGTVYFVTDASASVLHAKDINGAMTWKGEIQSSSLPSSGTTNDFYYLLDKSEGRIYRNGWKVVR